MPILLMKISKGVFMDSSKLYRRKINAIRHFKLGQVLIWVGDADRAANEFGKCKEELSILKEYQLLHDLKFLWDACENYLNQVKSASGNEQKSSSDEQIVSRAKELNLHIDNNTIKLLYTIGVLGQARIELRAKILPWRQSDELSKRAIIKLGEADIVNKLNWKWMDVNHDLGYTGLFVLNIPAGTIYGDIVTHQFLRSDIIEKFELNIIQAVKEKLWDT